MDDYIFGGDNLFYKHEISDNISPDTYSMHIHGAYELFYFLDGNATHVIEDRKYKLKKHDLILIRPFQYHFIQINAPSRYERYDILFDSEKHGIDSVNLIPDSVDIINIENNATAMDIFRRCDLYHKSCSSDMFLKILSNMLSELFYNLHIFPDSHQEDSSYISPIISGALQYINENLCSLNDIGEIAEHLFISESYLFRLFKKELHQTPKQYICEKRLLKSQKLLLEGKKPTYVAEKCGFCDYTTFYRNYTARFRQSPSHVQAQTHPEARLSK
ncbi:MAG: helix-turn-helix domain-containing protein [Clostridia bacterium]|nr:helix-turn-helix domain-containing protein [Clostridia bacterium]